MSLVSPACRRAHLRLGKDGPVRGPRDSCPRLSHVPVTLLNSSAVCNHGPVCPSRGSCPRGCHTHRSSVPQSVPGVPHTVLEGLRPCLLPAPASGRIQVLRVLRPCGLVACPPLSCRLSWAGPFGQGPLPARLRVCFVLRNRVPVAAVTPRNLSAETEGSGSCATFIHTVAPWGGGPGGPGVSLGPRAVGQTSRGG